MTQNNWDVLLIGRRLSSSKKLDRNYKTHRISLIFNKGFLFYAEYNLRLIFFLLFKKIHVLHANDLDTLLSMWLLSKLKKVPLVYDSHEFFLGVPEIQNKKIVKFVWQLIERMIFPRLKHVFTVNTCFNLGKIILSISCQMNFTIFLFWISGTPRKNSWLS